MKTGDIKKRLRKDRPMVTVTVRMPEDVVDDLKRIAPLLGFSGCQPLLRSYVGRGLRADLERLESSPVIDLIENLKRLGVSEETIEEAVASIGR